MAVSFHPFPNRINGMVINITSNSSKPIDINNGTVLLDRQRRFTFEAEENSVALISLQYDSGKYAMYICFEQDFQNKA